MYSILYPPCYICCCPGVFRIYSDFPLRCIDLQEGNSGDADDLQMCLMRGKKHSSKTKITDPITLGALEYVKCYSPSVYNMLMQCSFIYEDAEKIVKKSLDSYFKDSGKKKKKSKGGYYYFYKYFYF